MVGERLLPLFTAPKNPEMQEEKLVLLPMLQSLKPSVHLSLPFGGTGTVWPAQSQENTTCITPAGSRELS